SQRTRRIPRAVRRLAVRPRWARPRLGCRLFAARQPGLANGGGGTVCPASPAGRRGGGPQYPSRRVCDCLGAADELDVSRLFLEAVKGAATEKSQSLSGRV